MKPRTAKHLYEIVEASKAIRSFTQGLDVDKYSADDRTRSAVERKFEIIGEALRRMRDEDAETFVQIESGNEIIGMQNRLIQGYDAVDDEIVLETVYNDLPKLSRCAADLLAEQ